MLTTTLPRRGTLGNLSPHGFHEVVYHEWGDPAARDVVVCVHGLTRNGRDFDVLGEALASTHRVFAIDLPGRGESAWLGDPADYVFPTYLSTLTALLARTGAERVAWVGTSLGGLLGMVMAAQPNTPVAKLVVNDVGPAIEPAALARIGAYVGADPQFASYDEVAAYIRSISPFGPQTPEQWDHLTRSCVRQRRRRPLGLRLRPGHRGAVSRQRGAARPVGPVGRDRVPDAAAARGGLRSADRGDGAGDDRARAATAAGRVRRRRPRPDAAVPGPGRAGAGVPARLRRVRPPSGTGTRADRAPAARTRRRHPGVAGAGIACRLRRCRRVRLQSVRTSRRHAAEPHPPVARPPPGQPARDPSGEGRAVARRDGAARPGRGGGPDRRRAGGDQPRDDERFAPAGAGRTLLDHRQRPLAGAREVVHQGVAPAGGRGAGGGQGGLVAVPRTRRLLQAPARARGRQAHPPGRPAADGGADPPLPAVHRAHAGQQLPVVLAGAAAHLARRPPHLRLRPRAQRPLRARPRRTSRR